MQIRRPSAGVQRGVKCKQVFSHLSSSFSSPSTTDVVGRRRCVCSNECIKSSLTGRTQRQLFSRSFINFFHSIFSCVEPEKRSSELSRNFRPKKILFKLRHDFSIPSSIFSPPPPACSKRRRKRRQPDMDPAWKTRRTGRFSFASFSKVKIHMQN